MRLVRYVCHMPIADFCIEHIAYARKNVVSVSGKFGPRNFKWLVVQVRLYCPIHYYLSVYLF